MMLGSQSNILFREFTKKGKDIHILVAVIGELSISDVKLYGFNNFPKTMNRPSTTMLLAFMVSILAFVELVL